MQCPLIKTKKGVGVCKLRGNCILLKRAEEKKQDLECFDLNETDYQEMQRRAR